MTRVKKGIRSKVVFKNEASCFKMSSQLLWLISTQRSATEKCLLGAYRLKKIMKKAAMVRGYLDYTHSEFLGIL